MTLPRPATRSSSAGRPPRPVLAGVLVGIGFATFLDEVVFHQLLHWHHVDDRSTPDVGLVSDGILHAGGWLVFVVGLLLYVDPRRRRPGDARRFWAGALIGWGGFQVYDGLVQHKLLQLHQIRYGVDLLPYDLAWNITGGLAVLAGLALLRRERAAQSRATATSAR